MSDGYLLRQFDIKFGAWSSGIHLRALGAFYLQAIDQRFTHRRQRYQRRVEICIYSERSLDAPSTNAMPVEVWNRRVNHVERHVVGWARCAQRSIHFRQELWNKKCVVAI